MRKPILLVAAANMASTTCANIRSILGYDVDILSVEEYVKNGSPDYDLPKKDLVEHNGISALNNINDEYKISSISQPMILKDGKQRRRERRKKNRK